MGISGRLEEVGGIAGLSALAMEVPTTAQARHFTDSLLKLQTLRELVRVCTSSAQRALEEGAVADAREIVEKAESDIFAVAQLQLRGGGGSGDLRGHAQKAHAILEKMIERRGELEGLSTGFVDVDALTHGLTKQELLVLAARPSMGKTALGLNIAEAVSMPRRGQEAQPVLFFSLEMSAAQLALRLICSRARVNIQRVRMGLVPKGSAEAQSLERATEQLRNAPLLIDDASQLTIGELRSRARRAHSKSPLGLVVVDYLQLIVAHDRRTNREQQVAEASRGLKALAKELDVPVLVLAQLNREADKERRTPRLSDLRESGAIEQDADIVMLIGKGKQSAEGPQNDVAGDEAVVVVGKNRNGPVGEVRLMFQPAFTRFSNFAACVRARAR